MRKAQFQATTSMVVLLLAFIIDWVLVGESSPLRNYFLWHVRLPNMWRALNIVPAIIAYLVAGNLHVGSLFVFYIGFSIQWLLVGFIISFVLLLFRIKRDEPKTILD
jgi:hypothetical protein